MNSSPWRGRTLVLLRPCVSRSSLVLYLVRSVFASALVRPVRRRVCVVLLARSVCASILVRSVHRCVCVVLLVSLVSSVRYAGAPCPPTACAVSVGG